MSDNHARAKLPPLQCPACGHTRWTQYAVLHDAPSAVCDWCGYVVYLLEAILDPDGKLAHL